MPEAAASYPTAAFANVLTEFCTELQSNAVQYFTGQQGQALSARVVFQSLCPALLREFSLPLFCDKLTEAQLDSNKVPKIYLVHSGDVSK